ncbi:MAG TPA: phosphate ABC transporter ATP-binding protein PstB [Trueperaceae bacterium]|nr:phosphate ABC transporter ATP-binding protein PstB [Trueperaceae bacterium]
MSDVVSEVASEEGTDLASEPVAERVDTVRTDPVPVEESVLTIARFDLWYGSFQALHDITLTVPAKQVTALIGASGSGKSTLLRSINRMNDLVEGVRVSGQITYGDVELYDHGVDPVEVRRRIGMVFQKPNPFPKSIYQNVAFGPRLTGYRGNMDALVERALRAAALWDEVSDKLNQSGLSLSGGQQQRLCIARALASGPSVVLMDEPTSALDPIATDKIERLIHDLKRDYTVVIVTHNMQQAGRVSDRTAFMHLGKLIEEGPTDQIFTNPKHEMTERYVSGHFG